MRPRREGRREPRNRVSYLTREQKTHASKDFPANADVSDTEFYAGGSRSWIRTIDPYFKKVAVTFLIELRNVSGMDPDSLNICARSVTEPTRIKLPKQQTRNKLDI